MQNDPASRSLSGLYALAFTYLGALGFAAILSPWIYNSIQDWHTQSPNRLTEEIADNGFDDYFDRVRWLWVLICLPWLIKRLQLKGWAANGFAWKREDYKAAGAYFLSGMAILLAVAAIRLITAEFTIEENLSDELFEILMKALLGALLVSFLEEYVFRSLIWKAFAMWRPLLGGIVFASIFFSYTHYKMPDELWNAYEGPVGLQAGLYVAWGTMIGVFYDASLLDFINLFLLGVWLSMLRTRTNNLARSMGLHAGIVFALLTYVDMLDVVNTPFRIVFGGPGLRDGIVTFLIFSAGIFIERRKLRYIASSHS
ncbi:MAG: lysostaphin resistance A-like protein [Opitutales bacterium]